MQRINSDTEKPYYTNGDISVRMRTLRRLFNIAIERTNLSNYPFKTYRLSRFNKNTKKRALKEEDIKKLFELKLDSTTRKYRPLLYFKFMFYCRGMDFSDMASLKQNDIKNGRISYNRNKAKKDMSMLLVNPAKEIVEYFKPNQIHSDYVFPILGPQHKTQKQKKDRIKTILGRLNKDLKDLAIELNIEAKISSYYSRHSFATLMKYMGIPIE